jgi:hypothetical protein
MPDWIRGLIVLLLAVWIVCMVVGFAVKAVLWLAIFGLVAFVATAAVGGILYAGRDRRP